MSDLSSLYKDTKGVRSLIFPGLSKEHGIFLTFTTRIGGVSPSPYRSLNLGLHVGDKKENVIKNRKILAEALGFPPENLTTCRQVHGEKIQEATKADIGKGAFDLQGSFPGTDGMFTTAKGVYLSVLTADCLPVAIVDLQRRYIGVIHMGWRGLVRKMPRSSVSFIKEVLREDTEDALVFIGPSIGVCCFEVEGDTKNTLLKAGFEYLKNGLEKKSFFDLKSFCRNQFVESGIKRKNIWVSDECTSCCSDAFFSYRRDLEVTGRQGVIAGIAEKKERL